MRKGSSLAAAVSVLVYLVFPFLMFVYSGGPRRSPRECVR